MKKMTFSMRLPSEKYQRYYEGAAKAVVVTSEDGRTLRFPASALQKFVTHEGIAGRFEIVFDENNKLVGVKRLE